VSFVSSLLIAACALRIARGGGLQEFLRRHWSQIIAADFFNVEVWTYVGLKRFLVLFFIDLATRRVEIGGIAHWKKLARYGVIMANLRGWGRTVLLYGCRTQAGLRDAAVSAISNPIPESARTQTSSEWPALSPKVQESASFAFRQRSWT
jgi:hypothetical protein